MDYRSPAAFALVALGGAIGSVVRFAVGHLFSAFRPENPFLTVLTVNVVGSFLIGVVAALLPRDHPLYLLFVIGLLGGFTTFSSFSLDLFAMIRQNMIGQMIFFALGQVVIGLVGAALGYWIAGGR